MDSRCLLPRPEQQTSWRNSIESNICVIVRASWWVFSHSMGTALRVCLFGRNHSSKITRSIKFLFVTTTVVRLQTVVMMLCYRVLSTFGSSASNSLAVKESLLLSSELESPPSLYIFLSIGCLLAKSSSLSSILLEADWWDNLRNARPIYQYTDEQSVSMEHRNEKYQSRKTRTRIVEHNIWRGELEKFTGSRQM